MKVYQIISLLFVALGLLVACDMESLSDTYKDYAGDEIRYIGKCTDLAVSPGWKRLMVKWQNNQDQIIKQVKVVWKLDELRDSVLLERGTTEYSIESLGGEELGNGNYEINVYGVDASGKTSIASMTVGRPYTYEHEDVVAFNRLISKNYFIHDRLVLCFLGWQDNMKKATLSYTEKGGTETKTLELTADLINRGYYLLEDEVDVGQPVVVYRTGELPECQDVIELEPYILPVERLFESEYAQEIKRQFGLTEISSEWVERVETLYLDWSFSSFQDLLNFPNLKTLVLGSRRYILPGEENSVWAKSTVAEKERSDFALRILHELTGLKIIRYNNHYPNLTKTDFIEERGNTNEQPSIEPLDVSGLEFTVYPEDDENIPSGLDKLTDGDVLTNWRPLYMNTFATYELTLDMKEARMLKGLCLHQTQFRDNPNEIVLAPEMVRVKVSNNGAHWVDATYTEDIVVGKSSGEVNYINFSEATKSEAWRYIQVQVNAGKYGTYYYSTLAEITLY